MSANVEVHEEETIQIAIKRFRKVVSQKFSRSWYKSRVGYYEKPSIRKRRKQHIAEINRRKDLKDPNSRTLKMKMGLSWLYERKNPWP